MIRPLADQGVGTPASFVVREFDVPAVHGDETLRISALGHYRAFINGRTYAGVATGSPPRLPLQAWIGLDGAGKPIALDVNGSFPGLGFPGTQSAVGFQGSSNLVRPDTFVFVPDADGDLATLEAFPAGRQIRQAINQSVLSTSGEPLVRQAVASTTVGVDVVSPEVIATPAVDIVPGAGDTDVDPMTPIRVRG